MKIVGPDSYIQAGKTSRIIGLPAICQHMNAAVKVMGSAVFTKLKTEAKERKAEARYGSRKHLSSLAATRKASI